MKRLKISLILIISSIVIWSLMHVNVYGVSFAKSITNLVGATKTYDGFDMWGISGHIEYINNGTVNVSNGFNLSQDSDFINNGELTLTGNYPTNPLATFYISNGCSLENAGTMRVSGYYNFGAVNTFINTGKLFLSNIANANCDGLNNTGIIVYADDMNYDIIRKLKSKTTAPGQVMSQTEYNNGYAPSNYTITYDLSGGSWINTPSSDIFSYDDTGSYYYKFETHAPFVNIASNLKKDGYNFVGWTCTEKGINSPSKYIDLITSWKSNITLKAVWEPTNYNIYYYLDNGYFDSSITTPIINNSGSIPTTSYNIESADFTLPTPSKNGYTFDGWILGGTTTKNMTVTIARGTQGDKSYTATWIPNGNIPYTVNVFYMDKNGNYSTTPDKVVNLTGEVDTQADIPETTYNKSGYTYDNTISTNSGMIAGDGSLVLNMYYKLNEYDVTFYNNDGTTKLYSYKGYYGTTIKYLGASLTYSDSDYDYTFKEWATEPNAKYGTNDLGPITGNKNFYAIIDKKAKFCIVSFDDITGFKKPSNSKIRINKGEKFEIELYLENDNYYIGSAQWINLIYKRLWVRSENKGLKLDQDYTITFAGYGKPAVISIPNVTEDLTITFTANYHKEHVCTHKQDTVKKEATYTETGIKVHTCYKCGKTFEETIAMLEPEKNNDDKKDSEQKENNDKKDDNSKTEQNTNSNNTNNPKTGESSNIFAWITTFLLSSFALIGTVIYRRKNASK